MPAKIKQPSLPQDAMAITQQVYQGPLPPPKVLEAYEKVLPGTAEKILGMALRSQEHVIFMDRQGAKHSFWRLILGFIVSFGGQLSSTVIALVGYYMAYLYVTAGEPALGYGVAGTSTVLCGYLIWWKERSSHKDENKKR